MYKESQIPAMPMQPNQATQRRIEHSGLRRRMLCGQCVSLMVVLMVVLTWT